VANPYPTRGVVAAASLPTLYADGEVLPAFPGRDWTVSKTPTWSTAIQTAASGSEVRAGWYSGPRYQFKLDHPVLRDFNAAQLPPYGSELQQLIAFFNARRGRYGFFFFYDPTDNAASNETIATGDGTTRVFQLTRTVGKGTPYAAIEPVYALWNNPTSLTVGGVAKSVGPDYTIGAWGVITFTTAPAATAAITWSGNFLFVCRFDTDALEHRQLMTALWEQQGLSFVSIFP
jgi:uncharacterized protein (TIGR02217 family)